MKDFRSTLPIHLFVILTILFTSLLPGCLFETETMIEDFSISVEDGDCFAEVEFETEDQFYLRLEGPGGIITSRHVQDTSRSRVRLSFFRVQEGRYTIRAMEQEDGGTIDHMSRNYEGPDVELLDREVTFEDSEEKVRVDLDGVEIRNTGELPLEVSTIEATLSFMGEEMSAETHKERYFVAPEEPNWVSIGLSYHDIPRGTTCQMNINFDPTYQEALSMNFTVTTPER